MDKNEGLVVVAIHAVAHSQSHFVNPFLNVFECGFGFGSVFDEEFRRAVNLRPLVIQISQRTCGAFAAIALSAICGAWVGDVAAGFGYWQGFWQWRGSGELCFADIHAAIVETEFKDAPALCHGQIFDIHGAEGFPFAGARESDVACKQFVV